MTELAALYLPIDADQVVPYAAKPGSRGPLPLPARLELRPRIPPGKRMRPDQNYYWYIVDGGREHSTRCPYLARAAAEEKLKHYNLMETVPALKRAQLAPLITFAAVIANRLNIMRKLAHTPDEHRNIDRLRSASFHLLRAFGKMRMAAYKDAYSEKYVTWYVDLRQRAKAGDDVSNVPGPFDASEHEIFVPPEGETTVDAVEKKNDASAQEDQKTSELDADEVVKKGEPNPRTTAIGHLRLLKRLTHDFAQKEETRYEPSILVPKKRKRKKGRFYFTRDELARLLWACRGRRWDPDKIWTETVKGEALIHVGGWQTRTIVEKGIARETRVMLRRDHVAARKGMARAIEIGFRTGSREEVIAAYTWPSKGRGRRVKAATMDVDDEGQGWNHRRGSREEDTNKSRPSSKVNNDLAFWLKIWKRADGKSKRTTKREFKTGAPPRPRRKFIVRQRNGSAYKAGELPFKAVARDAGLPWAGIHMLKKTANEIALVMNVGISAAAAALGTEKKTLAGYYTDENNVDLNSAKDAYDAPTARLLFRNWSEASEEFDDQTRRYDQPYVKDDAA
jgi:hypothetical protein